MSNVIQLNRYRKEERAHLFVNHVDGKVHVKEARERIKDIRYSLERINQLMIKQREGWNEDT